MRSLTAGRASVLILSTSLLLLTACSDSDDSAATSTTSALTTAAPATTATPSTTEAPATTAAPETPTSEPTDTTGGTDSTSTTAASSTTAPIDSTGTESVILTTFGQSGPREVDADNNPTDGPDGSGCTPGGDVLPDGVWLVQITSVDAGPPLAVEFDLLCRYTGDNIPDEDLRDFDDWVYNDSERLRTMSVADDASFHPGWCFAEPGEEWTEEFRPSVAAADALPRFGADDDPYQGAFLQFQWTWVRVQGGEIAELVDAFYFCAG